MPNLKGTRLNKFISQSGYCSRRQADVYIVGGQVKLNGKKARVGDLVFSGSKVLVNGFSLDIKVDVAPIFILLNKPVGITSTTEKGVKGNIVDFVNYPERIFPVGRLDKDSQGLIFLTNDGDIVNKILRSGNEHKKEYLVTVDKKLLDNDLDKMRKGIPMLGTVTKKCIIQKEGQFVFRITLTEGLNRQIRRMCEYVGYQVKKLERVNIMGISSDGLKPGDWRNASDKEIEMIYSATKFSKSENEPKASKSHVNKQNVRNNKKSKSKLKVKTKLSQFSRNHKNPSSKGRK
ncbi:MAG: 23S rRNA pseudouridine(2604) synthase RluF [Cryomorphaceae bacterium]|nr:23S rRNA pseudouridine(2604) synthase RluF [Cryomorphaceae bacterium]